MRKYYVLRIVDSNQYYDASDSLNEKVSTNNFGEIDG